MSIPLGTFTYDPSTDRGRVRLLVGDTNSAKRVFDDAEIDTFLTLYAGDVFLGAAEALDTIASSEALLRKKLNTPDFSIDSPSVSRELRARAEQLRAQSVAFLAEDADDLFDWAEQTNSIFAARDLAYKEALRELA